jgi:hypothetical protein
VRACAVLVVVSSVSPHILAYRIHLPNLISTQFHRASIDFTSICPASHHSVWLHTILSGFTLFYLASHYSV